MIENEFFIYSAGLRRVVGCDAVNDPSNWMLPPGVVQLKILGWLSGNNWRRPLQYGESWFLKEICLHYSCEWNAMKRHWRCVEFGSLSNLEKNRKNNKKKNESLPSLSLVCVGNECRRRRMTTLDNPAIYDCREKSWVKNRQGKKEKEEDGRKRGSHITHIEFLSSCPPWCACVSNILLHILPGTLTSCKWRKGRKIRKKKKAENLFFFSSSFFSSSIALVSGISCDYLSLLCSSFLLLPG